MKNQTLHYLQLAGYSIVLSIVTYMIIYLPVSSLNIISDDLLGGYFFMAYISIFVVILNAFFILWHKARVEDFSIKVLFFKMVKIFIPVFYLVMILSMWINSTGGSELLTFLKGVFSAPKSLYVMATSLLGALVYYFIFSVLFVKLYGVVRKRVWFFFTISTLPGGIQNPNFELDTHIPLSEITDDLLDIFFP